MNEDNRIRILMVCMGNICRSPLAHGCFEALVRESGLQDRIEVDSAGTHGWHVGEPPDPRARATAAARGIDISGQRSRRIDVADFERFGHILVMDRANLFEIGNRCPPHRRERVRLFMEYAPSRGEDEVPDPYYGGDSGFDRVLDMVEDASRGLLLHLRGRYGL